MAEKRLTKEIADQFLADDKSVDLSEFTEVDDDVAMALLMHTQNNENDNQSGDVSVPGKQRMSDTSRVILVVIFALPGALLVGFLGFALGLMDFVFGGDGDKMTAFDVIRGLFWLVFGAACVGASPGLILGLVLRVRWVLPFVGSAAGCLLGVAAVNGAGWVLPLVGSAAGCLLGFWLVFGGACVGASPGLILGLVLRVRWVLPFVGFAAGCRLGFAAMNGAENSTVSMGAGFVLFGLVVGSVLCLASRQEVDRQDCSGPSTY